VVSTNASGQIVSPIEQFTLGNGQSVSLNDLLIKQIAISGGNGADTLNGSRNDDTLFGLNGNDTLSGGTGNDVLSGANGADLLYGGGGNDTIYAGNDSDYVSAGAGSDWIWGDNGNDITQGGSGNDVLDGGNGNDLVDAGSGNDSIYGGNGREWIAGGRGNDLIDAGADRNLFAFNRGDGADLVQNSLNGNDTISLGTGIKYADLTLTKSGNNLVLGMGQGDAITLKDWYLDQSHHGVGRLQVVTVGGDYNAASSDKTANRKVEIFDFSKIIARFDAARAAAPATNQWAVMGGLLDAHLQGTDTAAIGGDLSYQYAVAGGLGGIGLGKAQDVLVSSSLNSTTPQALHTRAELEQGTVRLG
jgi:Ca2+-binding RTX toxin-like protein